MKRRKFDSVLKSVAELFKLLAHPDRIRLIGLLNQNEEMDVSHLCESMQVSQSSVSQHLKLLKLNKIVSERREGQRIFYKLQSQHTKDLIISAIELETKDLVQEEEALNLLKEMKSLWLPKGQSAN